MTNLPGVLVREIERVPRESHAAALSPLAQHRVVSACGDFLLADIER